MKERGKVTIARTISRGLENAMKAGAKKRPAPKRVFLNNKAAAHDKEAALRSRERN
jgi:hypothetical protein